MGFHLKMHFAEKCFMIHCQVKLVNTFPLCLTERVDIQTFLNVLKYLNET